jgi:Rrf2 family protein
VRLSKKTFYALRILNGCPVAKGVLVRLSDIARRNDVAAHSLAKTLPLLIDAGLVCAVRGQGGGIRLARPADQIRLGEVIRATETPAGNQDCDVDVETASPTALVIDRIIENAFEAFVAVMDAYTLSDLQRAGTRPPALERFARMTGSSHEARAAGA